jgi:pilus assembly protein CpaB
MARMQGITIPSGNRGLLVIAALAGLAAAVLFVVAVNNNDSKTNAGGGSAAGGNSVIALEKIPAGTKIEASMLSAKKVPDDLLVADAFDDPAKVAGKYAAYDITRGEQITTARIGDANSVLCGMACVVDPGTVAVGVEVKEVTAVGGLLYPGNRVDVSPSYKIKNDGSVDGCNQPYILRTETLLQNVQVLSVAQQQQKPAAANNVGASDPNSGVSGTVPPDAKQQPGAATITLALSQQNSLKVIDAQGRAKTVWISLRSVGDNEIRNVAPVNACYYD